MSGSKKAAPKVPALKLSLGGAPSTWHSVDGLPGFYHPDHPTPVGGPGEAPLELAREYSANDGAPVELVEITERQAETARELVADATRAATNSLRDQRQHASPQHVEAETTAITGEVN